jgi:hypothetical protein
MDLKQQQIYNTYLYVLQRVNDKPFKARKDFTKLDDTVKLALKRLDDLFFKFPDVDMTSFFEAPFFVQTKKYVELDFYTTQRAIRTYTLYNDRYLLNEPDSDMTTEKVRDSFMFISNYCKEQGISIKHYITHVEPQAIYPAFFKHIKQRKINFFSLFAFPVEKVLSKFSYNELQEFSECFTRINYIRAKYYSSRKTKQIVEKVKAVLISAT